MTQMPRPNHPGGVIAPILTPFERDGRIALDLYVEHARWVLDQGAHYLSPFGTTGEALSVPVAERMAALEALVEAGIPADRLMPGTGLCALGDTVALSRHAARLGCAGAMVLPAFFYPDATEDGHVRYFSDLIERVAAPELMLCLYHIPSHAGVGVSPSLAARLSGAFPETVLAYKDSSGDWANTAAVIAAAPGLAVFPGSESFLTRGLAAGGAGCISATCNLNVRSIRAVYDAQREGRDAAAGDREIRRFREVVQRAGLIGAMKALLAVVRDDDRWLNLLPPLADAERPAGEALLAALGPAADHLRRLRKPA